MSSNKSKKDPTKTILVIVIGFVILFKITNTEIFIYSAIIIGVLALISKHIAFAIDFLWMKLAWILGIIIPNILLSLIYFLFLTPIALLSKFFKKNDELLLKNNSTSLFKKYDREINSLFFKKPW